MKSGLQKRREKNSLFNTNKYLSNIKFLITLATIFGVILFFLMNYVLNAFLAFPKYISSNDSSVFSLRSMFIFHSDKIVLVFYVLAIIFIVVCMIRMIILAKISFTSLDVGQKGTSRWTTIEEIKEQYKEIPDRNSTFPGKGGPIVARIGDKLYIDDSNTNNVFLGITRSGKGEMEVLPLIDNLSRAEIQSDMIVNDMKIELAAASWKMLNNRGYKTFLINLVTPTAGAGYNPLTAIVNAFKRGDDNEGETLARVLCYAIYQPENATGDSKFFDDNSVYMLTALILAHVEDCLAKDKCINIKRKIEAKMKMEKLFHNIKEYKINNSSFKDYKVEVNSEIESLSIFEQTPSIKKKIDNLKNSLIQAKLIWDYEFFEDIPESLIVYEQSTEYEEKITFNSLINTFGELARIKDPETGTTALDDYFANRPELNRAKMQYTAVEVAGDRTKGSVFSNVLSVINIFTLSDMAQLTAKSDFVIEDIGFGEQPQAFFIGVPDYDKSYHFISSIFISQTYYLAAKRATMIDGQKCPRPIDMVIDESGSLKIPNPSETLSVCLGRNIRYHLAIQDYAQWYSLYGEHDADSMKTNCGNHFYIKAGTEKTNKEFSEMLGNETIMNGSRMGSRFQLSKTFTETPDEKPLLFPHELSVLKEGELVVYRTMKRRDLKGNKIKPHPIFATEETSLKYRYEYMIDDMPSGQVAQKEYDVGDLSTIDIKKFIYSVEEYFKDKELDLLVSDNEELWNRFKPLFVGHFNISFEHLKLLTIRDLTNRNNQMYLENEISADAYSSINNILNDYLEYEYMEEEL